MLKILNKTEIIILKADKLKIIATKAVLDIKTKMV